jgi:tripeptidyl-peptidase-1
MHFSKTSFFKDNIAQAFGGDGQENPCNQNITIECLQDLYNFKDYKAQAGDRNAIGISSYLGEFINDDDLQSFYKAQRPDAVGSKYKLISVNGMSSHPPTS